MRQSSKVSNDLFLNLINVPCLIDTLLISIFKFLYLFIVYFLNFDHIISCIVYSNYVTVSMPEISVFYIFLQGIQVKIC